MRTFEWIDSGHTMDYVVKPIKEERWVSDGLKDEATTWFGMPNAEMSLSERYSLVQPQTTQVPPQYPPHKWPVLIQAPTGSGKNYFVFNILASLAKKKGLRILNRWLIFVRTKEDGKNV